ncbi:class I adenylate-forming enzyme family protein [Natrialbaceae archaeon A-arb3/5]
MTLSLSRRADRFPERTAVVDISEERLYAPAETIHEDRVTYAELSATVDETASRLAELGIDAGDTVCLLTRNRIASLAVLFACRRLGATFAPISHRLTPVTVERPFEAIDPDLVLFESAQRDLVRSIPFDRSITLEKLATVDGAKLADDGRGGIDRDRPLVALHGSGGRPVVAFTARSLEWNCITAMVTWGLSRDETSLLVTPLSAPDGLVRVALPLLYAGGRLLLDRAFDPGDALTAIADEDVTFLAGRTASFRDLAAEAAFDDTIESLERAVPDESVPEEHLDPYRVRGVSVRRAYGRLECPTVCCQPDSDEPSDTESDETAVGLPVPDCRVQLLDESETAVEGSGTGRLRVSGPMVADGYVNAAGSDDAEGEWGIKDRTNERESAADSSDEASERGRFVDGWFATGEAFRRDETGRYYRD